MLRTVVVAITPYGSFLLSDRRYTLCRQFLSDGLISHNLLVHRTDSWLLLRELHRPGHRYQPLWVLQCYCGKQSESLPWETRLTLSSKCTGTLPACCSGTCADLASSTSHCGSCNTLPVRISRGTLKELQINQFSASGSVPPAVPDNVET